MFLTIDEKGAGLKSPGTTFSGESPGPDGARGCEYKCYITKIIFCTKCNCHLEGASAKICLDHCKNLLIYPPSLLLFSFFSIPPQIGISFKGNVGFIL